MGLMTNNNNNVMEAKTNTKLPRKRPVVKTLRAMKVGDAETFPLSQVQSVRNCKYNTMVMERSRGWDFTTRVDTASKTVKVVRIS